MERHRGVGGGGGGEVVVVCRRSRGVEGDQAGLGARARGVSGAEKAEQTALVAQLFLLGEAATPCPFRAEPPKADTRGLIKTPTNK